MNNQLHYIGVCHETANLSERAEFSLSHEEKDLLRSRLINELNIKGILFLFTCNRAEIYFESTHVSAASMGTYFENFIKEMRPHTKLNSALLQEIDGTLEVANRLVHVSNGLNSAIKGDKQIFGQVRKAYKESLGYGQQGSLLERAIQGTFRCHKRLRNETDYCDGLPSISNNVLSLIKSHLQKPNGKKQLLLIGAGEMIRDLIPHLVKWDGAKITITNRSFDKALKLSHLHQIECVDWQLVDRQNFDAFDIIITAVSDCKHLVHKIRPNSKKRLLIDLGVPVNINPELKNENIHLLTMDDIANCNNEHLPQSGDDKVVIENILAGELNEFEYYLKLKMTRTAVVQD